MLALRAWQGMIGALPVFRVKSGEFTTGDTAPLAQLDRASDYGSEGQGFESLRARRQKFPCDGSAVQLVCWGIRTVVL